MPFQLNRALRFGSQLFVNREDTIETLRPAITEMAKAGFTLMRLFMPWEQLEPRRGQYQWEVYDGIFDEAHRQGFLVVPTLMCVSPPGWMGVTSGMQELANLDDEPYWATALDHVRRVVEHYKSHPALDSWILWNEPSRKLNPENADAARGFCEFLRESFQGDIEAYNRTHYRPISSFDEIEVPTGSAEGFTSHRPKIEWNEFSVANLQAKLIDIGNVVREVDPDHPIHTNPHRVNECVADGGQSIWQQADIVDFIGCSAHPAWHSVRFPRYRFADSIAMFSDLMRSATKAPDDYFWVTELQGGTTLMSGTQHLAASADEARFWLLQGVAAGARAVVYWCTHGRTDGFEAGEWDLLDLRGEPTPQLEAISTAIRELQPVKPLLDRARSAAADVAIIISEPAMMLDLTDGKEGTPSNPRNQNKTANAIAGAYLLAADLSLEARFYDLARLRTTPIADLPPILLLPGLVVADRDTIEYLERVVESGRWVIGDGFFAWKELHGTLAQSQWEAADRLWGATCSGYESIPLGTTMNLGQQEFPSWFMRSLFKPYPKTEVPGRWSDGRPAFTLARRGDGAALRVGTLVFQKYFSESDPMVRDWMANVISQISLPQAPRLTRCQKGIRLRRLTVDEGHLIIALNGSRAEQTIEVRHQDGNQIETLTIPPEDCVIKIFAFHT